MGIKYSQLDQRTRSIIEYLLEQGLCPARVVRHLGVAAPPLAASCAVGGTLPWVVIRPPKASSFTTSIVATPAWLGASSGLICLPRPGSPSAPRCAPVGMFGYHSAQEVFDAALPTALAQSHRCASAA